MLTNASALKLEQLRNVEILRQRSLQESERCREMELVQEEKIRSSYISALQKLLYNREVPVSATDAQLKQLFSVNTQPLTVAAVRSHLERQVNVDVGVFGQQMRCELQSVLDEHSRCIKFAQRLSSSSCSGNGTPSDGELENLKGLVESHTIRRFIAGGDPDLLGAQQRLDGWYHDRTDRLDREAEVEKLRLETIARDERERVAEEAREYARLQSQEKSKAVAHLKLFAFESDGIRSSTDKLKMQTAAVGAKVKRAGVMVGSGDADGSSLLWDWGQDRRNL